VTGLQIREVLLSSWRRGRGRYLPAVGYSLLFKVLSALLIAPLAAAALRLYSPAPVASRPATSKLRLSAIAPAGIVALLSIGGIQLAATYLELAGLMRLLADHRLRWWQALGGSSFRFPRLVALGVWQLMWFLVLAAPFLAGIGLVYWLLWSGRDLNGLIVLKPREFWIGVGLAGALAAVYAALALRLFFRWLLAVPTFLFEPGGSVRQALALSTERMQPRLTKAACLVAIWGAALVLFWVLVMGLLRLGSGWVLGQVGSSIAVALSVTAIVLGINVAVATALGILGSLTFAALVLALHEQAAGPIRPLDEMPAA
jgi:glycerophosphoryl diester phosphodiesterase